MLRVWKHKVETDREVFTSREAIWLGVRLIVAGVRSLFCRRTWIERVLPSEEITLRSLYPLRYE